MPTPVSAARQYLTDESARALDEAVSVARRRSHTQTTSLHAISALLALPSSGLRDACARARSSAYSPRLQFRALDLCVSVSLDRLPSSKPLPENENENEPPISNSLMAAIKRSQANQRRQPDCFHLQQQTVSVLKVELKHLILSILDDPIASRVFGEAGFRSCDIKLAILQPQASKFPRTRYPPIFLCNLDQHPAQTAVEDEEDLNCRRICDILMRKTCGRNPLLMGLTANEALNGFTEYLSQPHSVDIEGRRRVLPREIEGLSVVCINKELADFVDENATANENEDTIMGLRFKGLVELIEKKCSLGKESGVVLSIGQMRDLVRENTSADGVKFLVSQFSKLLKLYGDRLWLMAAVDNYDTYAKLLARFPSMLKDWDLHLVPIISSKTSAGERPASNSSLMGSFVPFGGFFTAPSEFKISVSSCSQSATRCHLCNERYDQEVSTILKGGCNVSISDQYSSSLPSWLQGCEPDPSRDLYAGKATQDGTTFRARILELQKKWNDICQRLHRTYQTPVPDISHISTPLLGNDSSQLVSDKKESSSGDSSLCGSECTNLSPSIVTTTRNVCSLEQNPSTSITFEKAGGSFTFKLPKTVATNQMHQIERTMFLPNPVCDLSLHEDQMFSSTVTKVTTDLGLRTPDVSTSHPEKLGFYDMENLQKFSDSVPNELGVVQQNLNTLKQMVKSSSCSHPRVEEQSNLRDFKLLWTALLEKVGRQAEVIHKVSLIVDGRCCGSNTWLSFLGPDRVAKKRIAAALAETMFGNRDKLLYADLAVQDGIALCKSIFNCLERNDVTLRGKTVVDFIAAELVKRTHSVVFLENVDKADVLTQRSLSQAIKTGKFPDTHGREISLSSMIFIIASAISRGNEYEDENTRYSEEMIMGAKCWKMRILTHHVTGDTNQSRHTNVVVVPPTGTSSLQAVGKRKCVDSVDSSNCSATSRAKKASKSYLDLNVPVQEVEEDVECAYSERDPILENSEAWLEQFLNKTQGQVVLKPFDFDTLAEEILTGISFKLRENLGCNAVLEIDHVVMVQMIAAAWLSDKKGALEEWIELVLIRSIADARRRNELTCRAHVKLVACEEEGLVTEEEQAAGICLPARILVN